MRVSAFLCLAAMTASSVSGLAGAPADSGAKTKFTVSQQTTVPGMTLQPGSYSIRVVDHLADRLIVRIDNPSGGAHSTFIGLMNSGLGTGSSGMVNFTSGPDGGAAAKGFNFPGGTAVEFVYPKAEAVSLAKLNGSKVVAIDPASEGRVAANNLSKDDMEVVTLWTLSSTKVGPGDSAPAIKAEKYKTQQVASVTPPPTPKPVIARLPHTGSDLPLIALFTGLALAGAGTTRFARLSTAARR